MENFIEDLLEILIGEALALKTNQNNEYDKGKLFAYYLNISTIINQSKAFGVYENLPIKVRNFEPEILLQN